MPIFKVWRQKTDRMIYMTFFFLTEPLEGKRLSVQNPKPVHIISSEIQDKSRVLGISTLLDKALTSEEGNSSLLKTTLMFEITYLRTSGHYTMIYCDKTEF